MKNLRSLACCALALILLWCAMTGLSALTAMIPRSAVAENLEEAADFYETADMFALLTPSDTASVVHHYADAVLLNILWNQDSAHPLRAAMDAAYYEAADQTQGENLAAAVDGAAPNTSYARYWHGMLIFLKPLLTFLTMDAIKILGAVVLAALAAVYFLLAWKRQLRTLAISSAVGLVLVRIWIVPLCVEYYSCFALMFLFADLVLWRGDRLKNDALLFVFAGALTCFFDFLTCEILTLGLPLLCLLLLRREGGKTALRTMIHCCAAWLLAYALTWLCKWGLSAAVAGRTSSEMDLDRGLFWIAGETGLGVDIGFPPLAAVTVNLGCLFPMSLVQRASSIQLVFAAVCLAALAFWYLFRKEGGAGGRAWPLLLIAAIPLVRYAAIWNHAALHPFFTHRSLFLTITAVSCALSLTVQLQKSAPKTKKGRK